MLRATRTGVSGGVSRLCFALAYPGARSGGGAIQELMQCLRGGLLPEGLAGPGVQLVSDRG